MSGTVFNPTRRSCLTHARLRELVRYDADSGEFTNLCTRSSNAVAGTKPGCLDPKGYLKICLDGQLFMGHRLAWLYVTGCWPSGTIDHRNGRRSDNRFANLRDVPQQVNTQNQASPQRSNLTSSYLGVSFHRVSGKWRAQIKVDGKKIHLGTFDDELTAHLAYREAKRALHRGFVEERTQ